MVAVVVDFARIGGEHNHRQGTTFARADSQQVQAETYKTSKKPPYQEPGAD